jgi:hypothetical protein
MRTPVNEDLRRTLSVHVGDLADEDTERWAMGIGIDAEQGYSR